jgi:CxxC motif-containing protein
MAELICIVCPMGCRLTVDDKMNVTGNSCKRGEIYGKEEVTDPKRTVTSTVRIAGAPANRCPVKTDRPIQKHLIFRAMELLDSVELSSPVAAGEIVLKNILDTEVNFIATKSM